MLLHDTAENDETNNEIQGHESVKQVVSLLYSFLLSNMDFYMRNGKDYVQLYTLTSLFASFQVYLFFFHE